jgi:hypothetical protein
MATLEPVTLEFLTSAPIRHTSTETIPHLPDAVFAAVAEDPAGWGGWFPGFTRSGRYVTAAPHGIGAVREVTMLGNRYRERIVAWEAPTRWAFVMESMSIPLARRFAEEYRITPVDSGSQVAWTLAMDPRGPLRAAGPLTAPLLSQLFRRAMRNLDRQLALPRSRT